MTAAGTRRTRGTSAGLDRGRIIATALEVIDVHGVEGLTMRRLGKALGVDASAVYWHFPTKAAVLDAVVEHEAARLAGLEGEVPLDDPIEVMVAIALHFRRVLSDHPNLAPLLASRPLPQEHVPILISFGTQQLRLAGFADEDIPRATEVIVLFGLGYVTQELGLERRRAELGRSFREQQEALLAELAAQPGDTSLEESIVQRRLHNAAHEEDFAVGLRSLLHGLRLGLGRPPT